MHAFFHIFALTRFFMNRKKTRFFTKTNLGQNRHSYPLKQKCLERFSSLKKTRKNIRNTFSKYIWAPKMLQKSSFFHQKWASRFQCKLFIFHRYLYVNGPKNMCKNRSFFHSKFMFFSTAKSSFSPFSVYRWSTKVEQIM